MDIPRRMDVIREYRQRGGSVGAVFPIHYPRELLRAFDILHVEVWGPPRVSASQGAAHLQSVNFDASSSTSLDVHGIENHAGHTTASDGIIHFNIINSRGQMLLLRFAASRL